jgi:hypothetical protein
MAIDVMNAFPFGLSNYAVNGAFEHKHEVRLFVPSSVNVAAMQRFVFNIQNIFKKEIFEISGSNNGIRLRIRINENLAMDDLTHVLKNHCGVDTVIARNSLCQKLMNLLMRMNIISNQGISTNLIISLKCIGSAVKCSGHQEQAITFNSRIAGVRT